MKSRQKFTVSEKHLLKKTESEGHFLDLRVRRKLSTNPLLQKNINFLHTYNNLLRKPFYQQVGDADSYFKKSLRNDPVNIVRDLNLPNSIVKQTKSVDNLNKRKFRSRYTLVSPRSQKSREFQFKLTPKSKEDSFEEIFTSHLKEESDTDTETTAKDYFTPKASYLGDFPENQSDIDQELEVQIAKLKKQIDSEFDNENANSIMADGVYDDEKVEVSEQEVADEEIIDNPEDTEITLLDNVAEEEQEEEYVPTDVETDDDELKEVEKMIEAASQELQQVVEENEKIMGALEGEGEGGEGAEGGEEEEDEIKLKPEGGDGSCFEFDPTIDSEVLRELESAEKQAKETAKIICELRNRVGELLKKEQMTQNEAVELEEKNKLLRSQMILFEEKIKRIQFLITQTNLFENMIPAQPPLQQKHKVDALPKVIVCGLAENNMPKIIVCDDEKSKKKRRCSKKTEEMADSPRTEIAKKLNECYCMQEKLAAENANLEGKRYELQAHLLNKDQTVECLQKQLQSLQTEMRMICQENRMLNDRVQQQCVRPPFSSPAPNQVISPRSAQQPGEKKQCGRGKGICPADIESRLQEYSNNTQNLEKQLVDMEIEVRNVQKELTAVQKEREHLEHHRKMFCPPTPCAMPPCMMKHPCMQTEEEKPKSDQPLRELREQYDRLQDDFKSKLMEVASLRAENEKLKDTTKQAEETKKVVETKCRDYEFEIKKLKGNNKLGNSREQLIELEQQLNVSKQRFREAQDELEELRSLVEDQKAQANDYRTKYLDAQQTVEEQKRQIDLMEVENQHVTEQVNLEIQRVKNQFQEKLQELMPLPDILKSTQLKLKEAQQMHLLAERNNEAMGKELQQYKDKIAAVNSRMHDVTSDQQLEANEKAALQQKINEMQEEIQELQNEKLELEEKLGDLTEKAEECERLAEERIHEITQLESQLENVREESARQVARTKDRCEIVRKSMQNEVNELERQIAQSKAIAKAAQKDRDDIRQKMQAQISNLNENFEDAQMRIRSLQGHVNFLKNTYGDIYANNTYEVPVKKLPDPCSCNSDY